MSWPQLVLEGLRTVVLHSWMENQCAGVPAPQGLIKQLYGSLLSEKDDGPADPEWDSRPSDASGSIKNCPPSGGSSPKKARADSGSRASVDWMVGRVCDAGPPFNQHWPNVSCLPRCPQYCPWMCVYKDARKRRETRHFILLLSTCTLGYGNRALVWSCYIQFISPSSVSKGGSLGPVKPIWWPMKMT